MLCNRSKHFKDDDVMNKLFIYVLCFVMSLFACRDIALETNDLDNELPVSPSEKLIAFSPNGHLKANIQWTSFGVPHIRADNLQSLAFGTGYAYARDNICILLEQMVKVRSQRAKYFGPDAVTGSGDAANIISDFGYHAIRVMASAQRLYPSLSENTRALLEGYSTGVNRYLKDTGVANLAPECADQAWVKGVTPQELMAYIFSTSQMTSSLSFIELAFLADPSEGREYLPYLGRANQQGDSSSTDSHELTKILTRVSQRLTKTRLPDGEHGELGSNGWGLGKEKTANSRGVLLANPHFPHTGNLRFWQSHQMIPGVLDVTGASLQGMPAVTLIGFNQHIAWTHTVSTARHFAVYRLLLQPGNKKQYRVDDEIKNIEKYTYYVEVRLDGKSVFLAKDFYYSHHGLMIETPGNVSGLLKWTDDEAYTLRDAVVENVDLIDQWLAMNMARNIDDFQQAFKDYDGVPWVNTMYADDQGHAFYIDKSRVLNLTEQALAIMRTDPVLVTQRQALGFNILPGETSVFEPDGTNGYSQAPKLLRSDYIQNSNDSYWATNPSEPLTGFSVFYGDDLTELSLRTRMSLTMLADSAGDDNKFTANEVATALLSNRTFLGEAVLADLLSQCQAQASIPILLDNGVLVDIAQACSALSGWDGLMNQDSRAAHLFREFAYKFDSEKHFKVGFDVSQPVLTPNTLVNDSRVLKAFATAVKNVEMSGFDFDLNLGALQFTEKTLADGSASGVRFPWAGSKHQEGGFNVFSSATKDNTLFPIHHYNSSLDVETGQALASGLTQQGYHINYGSSWMFVVSFTEHGPVAKGLLTFSQSSDSRSGQRHFDDQNRYYSEHTALRPILFTEEDITNDLQEELLLMSP